MDVEEQANLICLSAARAANNQGRDLITREDVLKGMQEGVMRLVVFLSKGLPHYTQNNAQESISGVHHRAVMCSRQDNLYAKVALACALASPDNRGFFTVGSVKRPLDLITGRNYRIGAFVRHIEEFCGRDRGPLLVRIGRARNYRYRFINPLMQPFIIMDGLSGGMLRDEILDELDSDEEAEEDSPDRLPDVLPGVTGDGGEFG